MTPEPLINNPATGPERGVNLRRLLDRHGVTADEFAQIAGMGPQSVHIWVNGGRTTFGRDLVTQSRSPTRRKLLAALRELEPDWTDADLHRALGVPAELRGVWTLPPRAEREQETVVAYEFRTLSGWISSDTPVQVTAIPGGTGYMQVWALLPTRTNGMILPRGEDQPRGELLGEFEGLKPL